jgi:hypothetical protein
MEKSDHTQGVRFVQPDRIDNDTFRRINGHKSRNSEKFCRN